MNIINQWRANMHGSQPEQHFYFHPAILFTVAVAVVLLDTPEQ